MDSDVICQQGASEAFELHQLNTDIIVPKCDCDKTHLHPFEFLHMLAERDGDPNMCMTQAANMMKNRARAAKRAHQQMQELADSVIRILDAPG